ncbi:hypothetical protein ACH4FX_14395 [Streptomyces sp. NPDC018019]|uniref:hypothetical protein n=1 Tax=Streptomyces sp. NPDC018019 TaxID=3365030 RepID=UPI0037AEBEA1
MKRALLSRPTRTVAVAGAGCLALMMTLAAPAASAAAPAADPVVSGKPYYLVDTKVNRGVTFEAYANWDYVLLTNSPGKGTPVVFNKKDDGSYTIKSTSSNWGGYNTWCVSGDGVYLSKPGECSSGIDSFDFVRSSQGGGSYTLRGHGTENYATYSVGGKGWLQMFNTVLPNFREFGYFKATPAN